MAEDLKVSPTSIQRNPLDVATELTEMYCNRMGYDTVEGIQEIFLKFYSVAFNAVRGNIELKKYLPEDAKK